MRRPSPHPHRGDDAVADTVGSILMVGITVVMSVVLGIALFSFEGPTPLAHADLAIAVLPGSDGTWGNGNEVVRILHRGGDALDASKATVTVTVGGTTRTLTGASQLGSTWADGFLRVGETWTYTWPVAGGIVQNAPVTAAVVNAGAQSQVVSASSTVASAVAAANPCLSDTTPPTVAQWSVSPSPLTALHSGAVTVTARLEDSPCGIQPSVIPLLSWRIGAGASTDTSHTSSSGGVYTYSVSGPAWSSLSGQNLIVHVGPMADVGGNFVAASPDFTIPILADCSTDNVAPSLYTTPPGQSPADVRSTTVGTVTVTAVLTDNCAGVKTTAGSRPHLWYSFDGGALVDGGEMTLTGTTASPPTATFEGSIPSPVPTWVTAAGNTLQYQLQGMTDLNSITGSSAIFQDLVDAVFSYTYANSNTVTTGSISGTQPFNNCCSAGAGSDGGLETDLVEGAATTTPSTAALNANSAVSATGWTSATNGFASDNSYATFATNNPSSSNDLKFDLQDPVVTTGAICSTAGCGGVVLHAEVSITSFNNDAFTIYPCLSGGLCSAASPTGGQSSSDTTMTYDISDKRPGGGTWSWTDIANLQGVVSLFQSGGRDGTWRVDRVWVDVTSSTTTYAMNIAMGFPAVPAGSGVHTLDLRYHVTGDTFYVEMCQDPAIVSPCLTWTRLTSTPLTSAGAASWTYTMTATEYASGPRIRFTDANPTSTVQGHLYLDWVRVDTL